MQPQSKRSDNFWCEIIHTQANTMFKYSGKILAGKMNSSTHNYVLCSVISLTLKHADLLYSKLSHVIHYSASGFHSKINFRFLLCNFLLFFFNLPPKIQMMYNTESLHKEPFKRHKSARNHYYLLIQWKCYRKKFQNLWLYFFNIFRL